MKHTFKRVVVLALVVIMCISSIMPSAMAATTACPGEGATHTAYNCTYTEGTVSAATCDAAGSVLGVCSACGDNFILRTVEATGHDWEYPVAACGAASYRNCKTCKKTEIVKAASGHVWGDWEVAGGVCRVGEKRVQTCTVCGVKNETLMTDDHSWVVGEFVAPARCGTAGYSVYVCANKGCGAERSEEVWLGEGATSHSWATWTSIWQAKTDDNPANDYPHIEIKGDDATYVARTCTVAGQHTDICQVCGITRFVVDGKNTTHTSADIGTKLQFVEAVFEDSCVNWKGHHAYWKCYDCGLLYKANSTGSQDIKEVGSDDKEYWKTTEYTYNMNEIGDPIKDGNGTHTTNASYVPEINNKGHHHYIGAYKEATCTEAGYANQLCAICGTTRNTTTAALGHLFAPDVPSADQKKTIELVYNTVNNTTDYNAKDHNWTAFVRLNPNIKTAETAATCTTAGKYEWRCLRSGCYNTSNEGKKEVTIPAKGHNFSTTQKASDSVLATCTLGGIDKFVCNNGCGTTNDVVAAALGHKMVTTTNPATCTTEGSIVESCTRCNLEPVVTVLPIDPANHDWSYMGTRTEPTCTEAGKGTRYCTNCQIAPAPYEVPALGHTYLAGDDLAEAIKALKSRPNGDVDG